MFFSPGKILPMKQLKHPEKRAHAGKNTRPENHPLPPPSKNRKSDILWKVVMEEVFDDLLRFIFPDADQVYNMERGFEFLDKELAEMYPEPDKESATHFADKLVRVFRRDGQEDCILCHVEIQGETKHKDRPFFGERMFRYFYRIWDRYRKPVSAVAIFTGRDAKKMPARFKYAYRKTKLRYDYHTLSILDFTDEELEKSDNPFALVALAAKTSLLEGKISEWDLLDRKVLIASKLLKKGFSKRKIRAILVFLESYILFEDPEMNRNFKERIQPHDKNNIMGIDEYIKMVGKEEGIAEGRMEEKTEIVKRLLADKEFSIKKIATITGVSVDFVKTLKSGLPAK
jgi:predicted transposase/invertase (TIGR01784 family)